MGGNQSSQSGPNNGPCGQCNCESEVPRVIAACNKAGGAVQSDILETTITGLLGKENSNFIMKEYKSAIGDNINNDWVNDYNKVKETFNNHEGFIEGNGECVPCDCVAAADDIIRTCQDSTKQMPKAIKSIINDDIQSSTRGLISSITASVNDEKEINTDWENIFYPDIEITNSNMKEGYENIEVAKVTRDAISSRHNAFKDSPTFANDCQNNSYISVKNFITEEKNILDSLYNYYVTFVKDHESLYLHKEAFAKTIYNKLEELKSIQKKIDSYKKNLHIDNRKNMYQSNNYEFYTNIRFYMLIVYYSVLIVYLIFSKFFSEKQYTNKVLMVLLFIYIIMPIILEHLINFIYEGYIYFLEYNNLKEDTKSYEDIINKNSV